MGKNIVIIILSILLVSLSGYIVYDKSSNELHEPIINTNKVDNLQGSNNNSNETNKKEEDKMEINNDNETNKQEEINNDLNNSQNIEQIDNVEFEKYEEVIETELFKMLGFKSLSETPNQDRLAMVFEVYNNKYNWKEKITISELDEVKKNSAIRNIDVEYTNLTDYNMSMNYKSSPFYNKKGNVYEHNNAGHKEKNMSIIYKELINSDVNNNEIKLSYKFIFAKTYIKKSSTTPGYHSLHYNLKDKEFKEFSFMDIHEETGKDIAYDKAKSYIIENYETIKDSLYTYNFVFINEDNNIILKDYYRE